MTGDYLVAHFPAWEWRQGEPSKMREYLPNNKQFLLLRDVPCTRRVSTVRKRKIVRTSTSQRLTRLDKDAPTADDTEQSIHVGTGESDDDVDAGDDWILTHAQAKPRPMPSVHEAPCSASIPPTSEEVEGLGALADGMEEHDDPAQFDAKPQHAHDMALRTYDCMITYDKYYQTPRMWLVGFDEHGIPLRPSAIYEDVASDHAFKTVTMEPFPHGNPGVGALNNMTVPARGARKTLAVHVASIHPCKHANMMQRMLHFLNEGSGERRAHSWSMYGVPSGHVHVDMYLVLFLQFMASIMPTMELDAAQSSST